MKATCHSFNPLRRLGTLLAVAIGLAATSANADPASTPAKPAAVRIAVLEFTPGTNAAGMTFEAKRHLQASIANSLHSTRRFHVVDVRNTREATQPDLLALNGPSTAPAIKAGLKLHVSYILTGTITVYDTKTGQATLNTRLIEVATGKVKHSGETISQSASPMTPRAGEPEMMAKVLKPAIEKLTAQLTENIL